MGTRAQVRAEAIRRRHFRRLARGEWKQVVVAAAAAAVVVVVVVVAKCRNGSACAPPPPPPCAQADALHRRPHLGPGWPAIRLGERERPGAGGTRGYQLGAWVLRCFGAWMGGWVDGWVAWG